MAPSALRVLKAAGVELSNIDAVNAGFAFSLARDTSGKVWAWGAQTYGRCGTGLSTGYAAFATTVKVDATVNVAKPELAGIAQIAAGQYFGLAAEARTTDGTGRLWAWGHNTDGQLGDGTVNPHDHVDSELGKQLQAYRMKLASSVKSCPRPRPQDLSVSVCPPPGLSDSPMNLALSMRAR
jgi:alpha-tubulin suppressor-like RCC1 family protein